MRDLPSVYPSVVLVVGLTETIAAVPCVVKRLDEESLAVLWMKEAGGVVEKIAVVERSCPEEINIILLPTASEMFDIHHQSYAVPKVTATGCLFSNPFTAGQVSRSPGRSAGK